MPISKRRIKWGFLLVLIAGVMLFVRPPRSWLDKAIVKQIDPELRVSEVKFYRKDSVVEVGNVLWSKYSDDRAFGLKADRIWLAVDGAPLADRQIVVPRGQIENALLFFNDYAPKSIEPSNVWNQELAKHSKKINWNEIKQHFASLLAPGDIELSIRQRVDGWIERSRDIQRQVQRITGDIAYGDNPLRYEEELRLKIERIDQLAKEHREIVDSFQGIDGAVLQKCNELKSELQLKAREVASNVINANELLQSKKLIAETLMLQVAKTNWESLTDCGQIAQLVANNLYRSKRGEFNRDMLVSYQGKSTNPTFIAVGDLRAEGVFAHRDARSPFRLAANVNVAQSDRETVDGVWRYNFFENDKLIGVRVEKTNAAGETDDRVSVQLRVVPNTREFSSPSDSGSELATEVGKVNAQKEIDDSWTTREDYLAKLDATTINGELSGIMELTTLAVDGQPAEAARILRAATRPNDEKLSFQVRVSGRWQDPQFTLQEELPEWLISSIEFQVNEELITLNSDADKEIRADFDRTVLEITNLVRLITENGKAIVESHGQQLTTARAMLQRRLEEFDGTAFSAGFYRSLPQNSTPVPKQELRMTSGPIQSSSSSTQSVQPTRVDEAPLSLGGSDSAVRGSKLRATQNPGDGNSLRLETPLRLGESNSPTLR